MRSADQYLSFTNSGFGKWVTGSLGLPQPVQLARKQAGKPDLRQPVLMGAAAGGRLTESLAALFRSANLVSLYHPENDAWREAARRHEIMTARYTAETSGKVGALLFDATGIEGATDLESLYRFFHKTVRSVGTNGRIVVFGTTPEDAGSTEAAAIQRGLEGFTRSLGKEVHRAIAVQLVYVRPGAEAAIESTARFFLSSRAAYVSGQVVRIAKPVAKAVDSDPGKPQAGRTVLVTGASRGIGAAIADLFARDGAHVVALDIPPAAVALDVIAERLGGSALPLDITAPDAAEAILSDAKRRGGYDVVVHNAGITRDKTIARMDAGRWDSVMDVNLFAPLRITEALLSVAGSGRTGVSSVCRRSAASPATWSDQLRPVQGRPDRRRAASGAGGREIRHHHQCGRAGLHRDADDRGNPVRDPRGGTPDECDEPGRSADRRRRGDRLVRQPGERRRQRPDGQGLRPEPAGGMMDIAETAVIAPELVAALPTSRTILVEGLKSLRKKPSGPAILPTHALTFERARLDERKIATYAKLCGFTPQQGVPVTYPHMQAFQLHMLLMLRPDFPYPLVGLVHLANSIRQHARLSVGQTLSITVRFGTWLRHERGQAFTIETVAHRGGELVWDSTSTYLRLGVRDPVGERVPSAPSFPQPLAVKGRWRLTTGLAKRYATVSGDSNPIHTSGIGARLFGFRRRIIHGMWSKARSIAALLPDAPVASAEIDVWFRTPAFLPGTVLLLATREKRGNGDTTCFELRDGKAEKLHLRGTLRAHSA